MKTSQPAPHNRRHLCRYPASELQVFLSLRQGLFRTWHEVSAYDFTRTGISVIWTGISLQEGTLVELRLRLALSSGELAANHLIARVCNQHPINDETSYGLAFDYEASRHMRLLETQSILGRIEGILDRTERLHERQLTQENLARLIAEREAEQQEDPSVEG